MATFAEVVLPLAIAAFTGYTDWDRCTPESHPDPLAENMCGTYRNALAKACTSMLSAPIPATSMSLTATRTISPIAFSTEVRNSIRNAHDVCTSYWTGTIGYDEFLRQTAEKVSVLNMLHSALPPDAGIPPSPFTDLAGAQGISTERVATATQRRKQELNCSPGTLCDAIEDSPVDGPKQPAPEPLWKAQLVSLEERLMTAIKDAREPSRPDLKWRLITETNFAFADARLSVASCSDLAQRARTGSIASVANRRIRIIGYADSSGEVPFNFRLSGQRARAAADCLVRHDVAHEANIISEGAGVLDMPVDHAAQARRASVYLSVND